MKNIGLALIAILLLATSCGQETVRITEDFNFNWKFYHGDASGAESPGYDDSGWEPVRLPHDWSIRASYTQENTAASTGFVVGGIGWYRKSFTLPASDRGKVIRVEFDGVYCNSEVWINGHFLGFRPNGYSSFSYELTEFMNYGGEENVLAVKADHSAYADTRWYTGSGIYRNVRLVRSSPVHIPQWGVQVLCTDISTESAYVSVRTEVKGTDGKGTSVEVKLLGPEGIIAGSGSSSTRNGKGVYETTISIDDPALWDVCDPNLYRAVTTVVHNNKTVDETETVFGIRTINFDPDNGFTLNGKPVKIKGVNIHHDAGAVGAAVTKSIWEYRINKLKSIGTNAIRMSHNPHSPELMEVCDEMGMLVMDEFFDEWARPKGKNLKYIGDNAAGEEISWGYSKYFYKWAERDLKDLIRRDFNHPSVIMWSIGNEIEWTYPHYSMVYNRINAGKKAYREASIVDPGLIGPAFQEATQGVDSLSIIAHQLSKWVKEMDQSRPVSCGSVISAIALSSGYADAVDVLGMNYQPYTYDIVHETFPEVNIIGSENHGAYHEWKAAADRDFVSGIFVWTGFAYLGEAGPWPRKGLNISFFDFAGFKTPRGHFYECLWKEEPKIYMVTEPARGSEYSWSPGEGWKFVMQLLPPPVWGDLRRWEWYDVNEHWNYTEAEEIIVQVYTNCPGAELFLNGESLGKKLLADFPDDNILKWLVPYKPGVLKVKGYSGEEVVSEYELPSTGRLKRIELVSDRESIKADNYDIAYVEARLYDDAGLRIMDLDTTITFSVEGKANLLAVDNGWEMNVESHYKDNVQTHNGRAVAVLQAGEESGEVRVTAKIGDTESGVLVLQARK